MKTLFAKIFCVASLILCCLVVSRCFQANQQTIRGSLAVKYQTIGHAKLLVRVNIISDDNITTYGEWCTGKSTGFDCSYGFKPGARHELESSVVYSQQELAKGVEMYAEGVSIPESVRLKDKDGRILLVN